VLPLLQESLANEGRFLLPLTGDSMVPTLPLSCRVEIVPLAADGREIPLGSLIVFAVADVLITHRLVDRRVLGRRIHWIAQGDGRRAPDAPIRPDQVLGQVVRAVDGAGQTIWTAGEEGRRAWFWIVRYHLLRAVRPWISPLWRRIRRLRRRF
jgi:hypothetical protein